MSDSHLLRIGCITVPITIAENWVREYTDPSQTQSGAPFAYPGYDLMDTGSGQSVLNDGDLLAPVLLNVKPPLAAFYSLQRMRLEIQQRLARVSDESRLEELGPAEISAAIHLMYEPLDTHRSVRHDGLGGTTYSKVLHRKRPALLPLHDTWVNKCYVSADGPVPLAKRRSWSAYMTLIATAMADDIRGQRGHFDCLTRASHAPLTRLRLLDIVAWRSRGITRPAEEPHTPSA